jgi:hypothetical protein
MENRPIVTLRKVPIDKLVDLLIELYNKGVDYIDISGIPDEEQDRMAISFSKDYMTEEGKKNFENASEDLTDEFFYRKLSDDDLNDLI